MNMTDTFAPFFDDSTNIYGLWVVTLDGQPIFVGVSKEHLMQFAEGDWRNERGDLADMSKLTIWFTSCEQDESLDVTETIATEMGAEFQDAGLTKLPPFVNHYATLEQAVA